ncbi:MAG: anaerobic ribonucleoside-triphosphate reductase activating protein [Chitinispirillaceae bacterium]|nr:anaerobic ribonucleoside-triphosphate reductase activating protein [Chitinispirillaceae bacterium]
MPGDGVTIVGWAKHSFIDFPGTIATVLFFSRCNLSCPWCHNPGVVRGAYPPVRLSEIMEYLDKRRDMIEGVVCSGGEPTLHAGLPALVKEFRTRGMKIKLDTNGLLPEVARQCAPDYLSLDIKALPFRYKEIGCTYGDVEDRLKRSIQQVRELGKNAEIRIPVASGFFDANVAASIAELVSGVERLFLQPININGPMLDQEYGRVPVPSLGQIEQLRNQLEPHVGACVIRGQENG